MRLKLRIVALWEIQFFFQWKKKIYLLIYLFTYLFIIFRFFAKFVMCKVKRIWWLEILKWKYLKTFSTYKLTTYTHLMQMHIRTWSTLLMSCLTSFTICKRRICSVSYKFMIKVKRSSAPKKSGAIMYK